MDLRDQIVDFGPACSERTKIRGGRFIGWLGIAASKFWRERYGKVNKHTAGFRAISFGGFGGKKGMGKAGQNRGKGGMEINFTRSPL